MTWLKTDDGEWCDPWVVMAGNEAYGAYQRLASYCAQYNTDGLVPRDIVGMIAGQAPATLATLERLGRIEHRETGSVFLPYFLDHNPSAREVQDDRAARSEKARRAANARWSTTTSRRGGRDGRDA